MKNYFSTVFSVIAVFILLIGCSPPPKNSPSSNTIVSLTTLNEADSIYRLWFMSRDGEVYNQLGKYDASKGWTAVSDGSVIIDRGGYGPARYGISTFSYSRVIATGQEEEEFGYLSGGDGDVYEIRYSSEYPFDRVRHGYLSDDNASGPIAAVTYTYNTGDIETDMYSVAVLGSEPTYQLYNFFEPLEYSFDDPDYTLPTFIAVEGASYLDGNASIAAVTLASSDLNSGQPFYFFGRSATDGTLICVTYGIYGTDDYEVVDLGNPGEPIGYGITAVGIGDNEYGIIHIFTTQLELPDEESGLIYHKSVSPHLWYISDWTPIDTDILFSPDHNKISADYTEQPSSGNPEILLTAVAGAGHDNLYLYRMAPTDDSPPEILEAQNLLYTTDKIPFEIRGFNGGVLAKYLPHPTTGNEYDFILSGTSLTGSERGMMYNFLHEHKILPLGGEMYQWKNLGVGHGKGFNITDLPLPHGDISIAHFYQNPNYLLAASTVLDNLPYVTLSFSRNDGIWWQYRDVRLFSSQEGESRFQLNPTVATGKNDNAYVMILEGVDIDIAPPISECIPFSEDYIFPAQIKIYPVKYQFLSGELAIADPPDDVIRITEEEGNYSHSWMVSYIESTTSEAQFYYAWRNEDEDVIKFSVATESDMAPKKLGRVVFEGQETKFAPMLYVRKDGIVLLLHGEKENPGLCFLDPLGDYNASEETWTCNRHIYLDEEVSEDAIHQLIKFQYKFDYWSTPVGHLDGPQPWSLAVSSIGGEDHILYTFTGENAIGAEYSDVYFSYSTDGGDNWAEAIRLGPSETIEGSYQFGPSVAVTPDGTAFITYYDMHDKIDGERNRHIVRKGMIFEYIDGEYIFMDEINTLGVVGDPENLPVHCGRVYENGEPIFPIHFIGDYIHVVRHGEVDDMESGAVLSDTHVHLAYPVSWFGEGQFTSQAFHDIVTPWNY